MSGFNVVPTPLVVVTARDPLNAEISLRRYFGRLCTHDTVMPTESVRHASGRDIRELIELLREAPQRALLAGSAPKPMIDQVT